MSGDSPFLMLLTGELFNEFIPFKLIGEASGELYAPSDPFADFLNVNC
jgi:hypothetical protein